MRVEALRTPKRQYRTGPNDVPNVHSWKVGNMQPSGLLNEADVRERAFSLWERRERPHGYEVDFWLQAERELQAERTGKPVLPDGEYVMSGTGSDCCR